MNKQLRLFAFSGIDLLSKLVEERKAEVKVRCHWNGKAW